MADEKKLNYINGIFIKKVWQDRNNADNILLSTGIKKKDFIKQIEALQEDSRGFVNLTIGTQKNDSSKFSMWLNEFTSNGGQNAKAPKKTDYDPSVGSSSDDLPF